MTPIPIELYIYGDPWCGKPIANLEVGYVPRVGDEIWVSGGTYRVTKVSQWGEGGSSIATPTYNGRICVQVQIASGTPINGN